MLNIREAEVLYDLTWNLAIQTNRFSNDDGEPNPLEFGDSRERFNVLLSWANEFERIHANTDWDNNELDYLNTVDKYYDMKVKELLS